MPWLDQVKWNDDGLVPVITQEFSTKQVLTLAWMNKESLQLTVDTGHAVYWSRSRQKLWHKGEQSGNQQQIKSIRLDCDCDAVLLEVVQVGGIACHTGRHHCFYQQLVDGEWQTTETVLKEPKEMYKPKETYK
jgi:phosphoribosyl-AMP cyclohydrolase